MISIWLSEKSTVTRTVCGSCRILFPLLLDRLILCVPISRR